MKRLVVLMSTYNGERFLREQIDSLLSQVGINLRILVRDDGSSDSTQAILDEYKNKGLIDWFQGNNIGWARSFIELVFMAPESDYYAFCDQDDIWLPGKLSRAVGMLDTQHYLGPLLYGSNLFYYRDGVKGSMLNLNYKYDKYSAMVRALTCGCTIVFNRSLCNLVKKYKPQYIEAHDTWVFWIGLFFGHVVFDREAYILYRQHGSNQIGAKRGFFEKIDRRLDSFKKIGKERKKSLTAEEFLRGYERMLTEQDRKIVSDFAYYNKSYVNKIKVLFEKRYSTGIRISDFWLKIRIILNSI